MSMENERWVSERQRNCHQEYADIAFGRLCVYGIGVDLFLPLAYLPCELNVAVARKTVCLDKHEATEAFLELM